MSVDRLTELETRLAILERRRFSSRAVMIVGIVALATAGHIAGTEAQGTSTVRAPFSVVDAAGRPIFSVIRVGSLTRVQIQDGDEVVATWGGDRQNAYMALGGRDTKATARLAVNFGGEGTGPSLLLADTDHDIFSVDKDSAEIEAPLTVTPKETAALRVESDRVTVTNALTVHASKGNYRSSLGATNLSVYGGDGASVVTSLGLDNAGKGRLMVGSSNGPRGVLGQPASGGISFALYDAAGTDYRIGMLAAPQANSFLRLIGGKREIELEANAAGGALHLFNDGGFAAASIEMTNSGHGQLSLGNSGGDTLVEAGVTVDGLGIVRAGPRLGGTTGVSQGGMVLPHSIVGQRGK